MTDTQITPEIEEMQRVIEEGRQAYRAGKTRFENPHRTDPFRGYWRLGWFQERDKDA